MKTLQNPRSKYMTNFRVLSIKSSISMELWSTVDPLQWPALWHHMSCSASTAKMSYVVNRETICFMISGYVSKLFPELKRKCFQKECTQEYGYKRPHFCNRDHRMCTTFLFFCYSKINFKPTFYFGKLESSLTKKPYNFSLTHWIPNCWLPSTNRLLPYRPLSSHTIIWDPSEVNSSISSSVKTFGISANHHWNVLARITVRRETTTPLNFATVTSQRLKHQSKYYLFWIKLLCMWTIADKFNRGIWIRRKFCKKTAGISQETMKFSVCMGLACLLRLSRFCPSVGK